MGALDLALVPRRLWRGLRGFVALPGGISLAGIALAALVHAAELWLARHRPGWLADWGVASAETARTVLTALAGASVSALVTVYSIVLLVYTLAAGSIGPRLLQRFGNDRGNQVSVGLLGACFLYSLVTLWLTGEDAAHLSVLVALALAVVAVLVLLFFVRQVSLRVTIDHEAAEISHALDAQIDRAIADGPGIASDEIVLPDGRWRDVRATETGYIDTIDGRMLVRAMRAGARDGAENGAENGAEVVVYAARSGDFVMEGERLATVHGDPDGTLDVAVRAAAPLVKTRTAEDDLRFSVSLLVEVALRALSPGVNDTFTAIACVDRLSASLTRARLRGLRTGGALDGAGRLRVVVPTIDAERLFAEAMPPLRRAARGNGLMVAAMRRALTRMALAVPADERWPEAAELRQLLAETEDCGFHEADRDRFAGEIEADLERIAAPSPPAS